MSFFKVGEKVVYPNHGVATIEEITAKHIEGIDSYFYNLRLSASNSVVMVPIKNAKQVGLREPIAKSECENLIKMLGDNFSEPPSDWKDRFKDFSDKMRTGDIFSVAEILKILTYLSKAKPLSFREKRMLERARFLVVSELAIASMSSEKEINEKVDLSLSKACVKHGHKHMHAHA
ncbi:MAG: CarD family transcriptional regulator [Acidobacteria bacterium]|nr:CarD family transcriptional regulator [Acidobacteriota bacterium]